MLLDFDFAQRLADFDVTSLRISHFAPNLTRVNDLLRVSSIFFERHNDARCCCDRTLGSIAIVGLLENPRTAESVRVNFIQHVESFAGIYDAFRALFARYCAALSLLFLVGGKTILPYEIGSSSSIG